MKWFISIVLILIAAFLFSARGCSAVRFEWNCTEYLRQASNANTVQIASERLNKAVEYIEQRGATKGNTGVLFKTPSNDIGYWYSNLKASQAELAMAAQSEDQLLKSNVLMKLRETLMDGQIIVKPSGISGAPINVEWCGMMWIASLCLAVGACMFLWMLENGY